MKYNAGIIALYLVAMAAVAGVIYAVEVLA